MNMIAQNTLAGKNVVITEADFDRLKHLTESPRYRVTHASLLMALKGDLDRGTVVAPGDVPKGIVTMHSQVSVMDMKSKESETYTLVYPDEADISEGRLSVLAPLGTALLGMKVGQTVKFQAPAGLRRLKIEKIHYQPEAAGDFHL
jgi:regulator of nucleoside diphosphate kinase